MLGLSFTYFYNQIVNMESPNATFTTWPTFYFDHLLLALYTFTTFRTSVASIRVGNSSGFASYNPEDKM